MIFKIETPLRKDLHDQFSPIFRALKGQTVDSSSVFDLSLVTFLSPLTILPIVSLIEDFGCGFILPKNEDVKGYLETIGFPSGISSATAYASATYVPIEKLSSLKPQETEGLISKFENLILHQLGDLPHGGRNAIFYPIDEITTNIFDHSKKETGWIFGQNFTKKGYLDICIIDRGRGFSRCYKEELGLDWSDTDAVKNALKGLSSKKTNERGFGLGTTKKLIVDGLGGQCFILSGSAGYLASPKQEINFGLNGMSWQGVIIAFRIPKITNPIDVSRFWE